MPYLNLIGGEPWAETLGVMLFPEDEAKRRAYIAEVWLHICPAYDEAGVGPPLPRSVLEDV
jgi:hypothetical protein